MADPIWLVPVIAIGVNYLPLLLHALTLHSREQAALEVEPELRGGAAQYGVRSLLLLLPLVVPAMALVQALQARRPAGNS